MPSVIAVVRTQSTAPRSLLNAGVQHPRQKTLVEALVEIADWPQLLFDPAFVHALLEFLEDVERVVILRHRLKGSFGGQHAALDSEMNPLQPLRIQEAGGVAQNHPTIARNRRDAPPASVRERLRAITDHLAAFKKFRNERMLLEFLQDALRIDTWIGIIQAGDKTKRHQVVLRAVNPRATVLIEAERVAHGV